MTTFSIHENDYRRYGLDDSRCGAHRPTGNIKLHIEPSHWQILTETRKWKFDVPSLVRKLDDCFLLDLFSKGNLASSLRLLIPLDSLSDIEISTLENLSEKRCPPNVPGDFYGINSDCWCIEACAPLEIAPQLIGYQREPEGCYFSRQPENEFEVEQAIEAVLASMGQLRYVGRNATVLKRIRAETRNMTLNFCQDDVCDCPTE
jgi:hypothetical protein